MRRAQLSLLLVSLVLSLSGQAAQPDGDPRAGKDKSKVCAGCHGPKGIATNPRYPHLAGQHRPYLVNALTAYRDGARENPEMSPMAQNLSDEDIRDLAAFFASQPRRP